LARTSNIGLDIGTTAIRAAELSFGSGGPGKSNASLTAYAQVPLPLGAVQDGEVVDVGAVATAIKTLWSEAKFTSKDVNMGVANQRVIVREADLPWQPVEQLKKTLPYQAEQLLPTGVGDAVYDFVPTGEFESMEGKFVSGLFVAAIREMVMNNAEAVQRGGLSPVMVDFNPLAIQRALTQGELRNHTVALVDVGARITNLVIAERGIPRFVRVLPNGGQEATDAVASTLGVAREQAERIKRETGVGIPVSQDRAHIADAVFTATSNLIAAIRSTFVYYSSKALGAPIDAVVLTGGAAGLEGFGQYLSSTVRLPVQMGNPLDQVKVSRGVNMDALRGNEYAATVAIGLAYGVAE